MKPKLSLLFLLFFILYGNTAFPQDDCDISAPGVAAYMYLCNTGTVADLLADGDGLKWYSSETEGIPLAGDTPVISGTYYVSQTINECESPRSTLPVYVIIIDESFISGYFPYCMSKPVSQFPYFYPTRNIYAAAEGGEPLAPEVMMTTGLYYYTIVIDGCESTRAPMYFVIVHETVYYADADADGFGNSGDMVISCAQPAGYVGIPGDCDDNDPNIGNCPEVPYTKLLGGDCGKRLYALDTEIYAEEVPEATQYRYEIYDGAATQVLQKEESFFRLDEFPTYRYSVAYTVRVAAYVNGAWAPYGDTCGIISPPTPVTTISNSQCGLIVPNATTEVYANAVPEATMYRFRLAHNGASQIIEKSDPWFSFNDLESYDYETSYIVDVSVQIYGDWSFFGSTCIISTSAMPLSVKENTQPISATISPNPFEEGFTVHMDNPPTEMVTVSIFDINARLIENAMVPPLQLSTVKFGAGFEAGVYIVSITQGTRKKALRVVKK